MDPVTITDIAALATAALADINPAVLTIGGAGVILVGLLTAYGMVTSGIRSKGKRIG